MTTNETAAMTTSTRAERLSGIIFGAPGANLTSLCFAANESARMDARAGAIARAVGWVHGTGRIGPSRRSRPHARLRDGGSSLVADVLASAFGARTLRVL